MFQLKLEFRILVRYDGMIKFQSPLLVNLLELGIFMYREEISCETLWAGMPGISL